MNLVLVISTKDVRLSGCKMIEKLSFGANILSISCHAWNKDRSLHIYEREGLQWKLVDVLRKHDLRIMGIDWAPNSNRIVTCAVDRNAYVWSKDQNGKFQPTLVLLRIHRAATCVKWSPLENKIAVGSGARLISICYFEMANNWWISKHIKKPIRSTITSLDWHPNNVLLVAGSTDYRVRVFSAYIKDIDGQPLATSWGNFTSLGQLLTELKSSKQGGGWIQSVSFSADGNKVCWVAHDSTINVADASNKNESFKLKTQFLPFLSCYWISSSTIVVAGHSCIPVIYSVDENNKITMKCKLDAERKKESTSFSAMKIFKTMDRSLCTESDDMNLNSIHQNAITCIGIYDGDVNIGVKKISTSGIDGQIVIWDISSDLSQSIQKLKI
ncbi:Actin-related protein 2/3 complex subunit 1A-A [Pseudolycoriella hygida]|uniref:Actin-related protein 2/3 complex subunit n=1 Tax=Pseudolycoriella hygida TaxID=35572 RepID=A0A9Q0MRU6_9DIPT|nr:Actin-related protein 2/3 complex subunit 1A-A [Pseudolycoriella hygida]